jgi:hypothetical protein
MTINPDRYYILDCNGKMVGSPLGYKTHSVASAQTNRKDASIYIHIWRAFRARRAIEPSFTLVNMIKQGAVL